MPCRAHPRVRGDRLPSEWPRCRMAPNRRRTGPRDPGSVRAVTRAGCAWRSCRVRSRSASHHRPGSTVVARCHLGRWWLGATSVRWRRGFAPAAGAWGGRGPWQGEATVGRFLDGGLTPSGPCSWPPCPGSSVPESIGGPGTIVARGPSAMMMSVGTREPPSASANTTAPITAAPPRAIAPRRRFRSAAERPADPDARVAAAASGTTAVRSPSDPPRGGSGPPLGQGDPEGRSWLRREGWRSEPPGRRGRLLLRRRRGGGVQPLAPPLEFGDAGSLRRQPAAALEHLAQGRRVLADLVDPFRTIDEGQTRHSAGDLRDGRSSSRRTCDGSTRTSPPMAPRPRHTRTTFVRGAISCTTCGAVAPIPSSSTTTSVVGRRSHGRARPPSWLRRRRRSVAFQHEAQQPLPRGPPLADHDTDTCFAHPKASASSTLTSLGRSLPRLREEHYLRTASLTRAGVLRGLDRSTRASREAPRDRGPLRPRPRGA